MTKIKQKYKYKNITITGLPGSGSTTLLNLLRDKLKFDGWTGFSGGEFMRKYAIEQGLFDDKNSLHHDAEVYDEEFDKKVDFGVREKLIKQEGWIIESWLSGFFAQGLDDVCKILVHCGEDSVRIDRIVNRDNVTVEEAKEHINLRYQQNFNKWKRMYEQQWKEWLVDTNKVKAEDPIDFWRKDIYDVVIDSYSNNQKQVLDIALNAIKKEKQAK